MWTHTIMRRFDFMEALINQEKKIINILVNSELLFSIIITNWSNAGCETWSLTLREEFRLRVFENRILRRIFGPKSGSGEWRRLHNEELFVCTVHLI